jgi:hypothetical protein
MQSQQIRGVLPRTVTSVSLRYPQLLCVLKRFGGIFHRRRRRCDAIGPRLPPLRVNDAQCAGAFRVGPERVRGPPERNLHQFKTTVRIDPLW